MPPPWHPTTGGLRLKAKSPLRRSDSPEDRQPDTKYFGGPLFNIHGLIDPSTVFTDKNGTRLVFDVNPRLAANCNPTVPVSQKKNYLFPPADLSHLIFSEGFEVYKPETNEPPNSPILARDSIMAYTGNDGLLLLADVALGTYLQEDGQPTLTAPAQGQQPVQITSPSHAATTSLIPSADRPADSESNGWGQSDDDNSPPDEQQPSQMSTHLANTTSISNASTPTQQQSAQAVSSQGFTPINPPASNGGFSPIASRLRPRKKAAPLVLVSSGGNRQARKKSQKSKPRTTGFNRETGEGMLTNVCGIVTPAKNGQAVGNTNNAGAFCCPRCNGKFTRARSVKDHFISCVNKHGNPNGLSWFDHSSCAGSKAWYFSHLPTVVEEDEDEAEDGEDGEDGEDDQELDNEHGYDVEQEQDEAEAGEDDQELEDGQEHDGEQEQDEAGDGDFQGQYDADDDIAAGQEDHEGDSHMGDEVHGRGANISAGSTGGYTPSEGTPLYAGASPFTPFPGTPLYPPFQGSDTPGYGPNGYQTPASVTVRGFSATPQWQGGSYTPSFGLGYETPAQQFPYDSDQSRNTSVIRRRETEEYGNETPFTPFTPLTDDDGDSVMS